MSMKDKSVRL